MTTDIAHIGPDDLVAMTAIELGFELPEPCIPGVIDALSVIVHHARIVEGDA